MKKLTRVLALSVVMALPFGISANGNDMNKKTEPYYGEVLRGCTVSDGDFEASGPCRQVRRLYAQYLAAQ